MAGHADRACFDLSKHAKKTKTELVAARYLEQPVQIKLVKINVNKKEVGKVFKGDSKGINDAIDELGEDEKKALMEEFEKSGEINIKIKASKDEKDIKLNKDFVSFEIVEKTQHEEKYIPSVIEPSFGINNKLIANRYW